LTNTLWPALDHPIPPRPQSLARRLHGLDERLVLGVHVALGLPGYLARGCPLVQLSHLGRQASQLSIEGAPRGV
jgi:hypothetical protein